MEYIIAAMLAVAIVLLIVLLIKQGKAGSGKADSPDDCPSGQCANPALRPRASKASISVGRSIGGGKRLITSSVSKGWR